MTKLRLHVISPRNLTSANGCANTGRRRLAERVRSRYGGESAGAVVRNLMQADSGPFVLCADSQRDAIGETLKLAAILIAGVAGFSRLAGADEYRSLARLG